VSRQREFLADASSVQFTRNPGGLSGASRKSAVCYGSRLESEHAPDLCHMFFGNGVSEPFFGLLATHPPIPDRIHAIDPTWDGKFPPLDEKQIEVVKRAAISELEHTSKPMPDIFKTVLVRHHWLWQCIHAAGYPVAFHHADLGNPTPLHLKYAERLRDSLPESIKVAAREPLDAVALIYAMLLSPDETERTTQLAELARRVDAAIQEKTIALYPMFRPPPRTRICRSSISRWARCAVARGAVQPISQTLQWLIESDGKIELFEFVLQKIVLRHLTLQFSGARPPVANITRSSRLCRIVRVLSALANVGSSDAGEIQKAFATGAPVSARAGRRRSGAAACGQCGVDQIDAALNRLVWPCRPSKRI